MAALPPPDETLSVVNPASAAVLAEVPLSPAADVNKAADGAARRRLPGGGARRWATAFSLSSNSRVLLEANLDDLARTITDECGKTLGESNGEMRRAIENVETACGMPMMMQGTNSEDIAAGIDEHMIRQPLGVVAAITPFNFPGMIPFWFLPYAVAAGNCFLLKPSERVPMTSLETLSSDRGRGLPAGRDSTGERRPRHGERDPRSSRDSRRQLCRLDGRQRATSTAAPRPTASARSARAARRILWS